jgi:hypothetical protein
MIPINRDYRDGCVTTIMIAVTVPTRRKNAKEYIIHARARSSPAKISNVFVKRTDVTAKTIVAIIRTNSIALVRDLLCSRLFVKRLGCV